MLGPTSTCAINTAEGKYIFLIIFNNILIMRFKRAFFSTKLGGENWSPRYAEIRIKDRLLSKL